MKTLYAICLCTLCYSCFPGRELQAEMADVTLVKVEEVSRYPNIKQKVFTWQTTDRSVSFVTFEAESMNIPIGTRTKVLLQK